MQKSKVEKYVYTVCQKTDSGFTTIDTISFDHAVKRKKETKEVLSNYPEGSVLILNDTEVGVYEMDDDYFFANATKIQ